MNQKDFEKTQPVFGLTIGKFEEVLENSILKVLKLTKEPDPPVKFYTRQEACKLLKISLPTLERYMALGLISAHRLGNRILLSQSDIDVALKIMEGKRR